jgi:hypothetical protein
MWKATLTRLLPACCALVLFGGPAGAGENEPLKFNNAIAAFNKKLHEAGMKFGMALGPALQGNAVDLKEVRKAYTATEKAVAKIKKEAAALKVPDSDSARKLAKVYKGFLKGQEEMVKKDMLEIVRLLELSNPPDQAGQQRLLRILQSVAKREQSELGPLQKAQQEFAREHGIKLEAPK